MPVGTAGYLALTATTVQARPHPLSSSLRSGPEPAQRRGTPYRSDWFFYHSPIDPAGQLILYPLQETVLGETGFLKKPGF